MVFRRQRLKNKKNKEISFFLDDYAGSFPISPVSSEDSSN